MLRGLYAAASALDVAEQKQEVQAYNLAHMSTPGYRQRGLTYESFDRVLGRTQEPTGDIVGAKISAVYHDFRPGALQSTGHPFDLALAEPDQFFEVAGPNGPLYSRNGALRLSTDGRIVTESGYALTGVAGPITVPAGTSNVNIAGDGNVTGDGAPLGRVRFVSFADAKQLTAVGPTLYSAPPEAGVRTVEGRVLQGYRESANVNPAEAMTGLIVSARYYEAAQRALRTIAESVQLNTRPSGS